MSHGFLCEEDTLPLILRFAEENRAPRRLLFRQGRAAVDDSVDGKAPRIREFPLTATGAGRKSLKS
jgi:hypothetical protein